MPVPTETLYNIRRLNVWFGLSALAAAASMIWMFVADFERPWRDVQTQYFDLQSALAHFEWLQFEAPEMRKEHQALVDAVEAARRKIAANTAEEGKLLEEQHRLTGLTQASGIEYGNLKAQIQVTEFQFEESGTLHGFDDPRTVAIRRQLEHERERLAGLTATKEKLEDQERDLKARMKAFYAVRDEAEKKLAAFEKRRNDARRNDEMYGGQGTMLGGLASFRSLINVPGFDFAAPKGIPGREEIRQVVLPDVRSEMNFLQTYSTDRCTTCHVGIDNPSLTIEHFIETGEGALNHPRVGEIVRGANERMLAELDRRMAAAARQSSFAGRDVADLSTEDREKLIGEIIGVADGTLRETKRSPLDGRSLTQALRSQDPLTREAISTAVRGAFMSALTAARPKTVDGKRALMLAEMSHDAKKAHLRNVTAALNEYMRHEGRAEVHFGQPLLAHPELDLYVAPNSAHSMNTMGCTVCHEGNGQETDFVLAAHTPVDHAQEHEWAERHYVKQVGVPMITFHTAQEFWERPMLLSKHTSASCVKCHTDVADLEKRDGEPLPSATNIVKGRELFTSLGCINCHAVEGLNDSRQVGPDLSYVGSKLSTAFMHRWIEYPKRFRPSTRMPHYFHQENNLPPSRSDEDPDPNLRSETEVIAMTHYLTTFSKPFTPAAPSSDVKGEATRGAELFVNAGCLACHANLAAKDPTDESGRTFGETWIVDDLVHSGMTKEAAKARFGAMSGNDRVDYAMRHLTPERRELAQAVANEERIAAELAGRDADPAKLYVPAAFTRFAPELSGMGTKLVSDPSNAEQVSAARRWLYDWLLDPRHYSSTAKMPRLFRENAFWKEQDPAVRARMNQQDILDVAEYLLTLRHDTFHPEPIPLDDAHAAEMKRLVQIQLAGQNTQSVTAAIMENQKADPGDALGMLDERIVRGVASSFGPGDQGERAVADILSKQDLTGKQLLFLGSKLITHYGCYSCHKIAGFENAARTGTELSTWARKLLSQLDFAFFAPGFEEDRKAQSDLFGSLFPKGAEFEPLVRDAGENPHVEITHTHRAFAYYKLRNPRLWDRAKLKRPYEKLKMPNFFLSEEETTALVTFLLSRQPPLVDRRLQVAYETRPSGMIARGRHVVNELNCVGCHSIDGNSAVAHQYFMRPDPSSGERTFDVTNAPPNLYGEGAKIQFPWLYGFLNNVEMLRPWLKIRMPSFHIDATQSQALVEYFVGLSQQEAGAIRKRLAEVHPFIEAEQRQASTPAGPGGSGSDASPWFQRPELQPAIEWLSRYALRNRLATPYDLDTSTASSPDEAIELRRAGLKKVIDGAKFLANLLNVSYPFSESSYVSSDEKRYEAGKGLLLELKCLACHVAGDPYAPGTTTDIKAPNFALTHRRLRYDWVRHWLINPQLIQPGTNMPQLFVDGLSAFKDFPPDEKTTLEGRYGTSGDEQIQLVTDFLFDLGARNATVVQPAPPEGPAPATPAPTEGQAAPAEPEVDIEAAFEESGSGGTSKPKGTPTTAPAATTGATTQPAGSDDFVP